MNSYHVNQALELLLIAAKAAGPFVFVVLLKLMLDFNLSVFLVKLLGWIPFRSFFREKPLQIKGDWEHIWASGGSTAFRDLTKRMGHSRSWQLGRYWYAEFISDRKVYIFFGEVIRDYVIGRWYDKKDPAGYFGTFEVKIINENYMEGLWLGHSSNQHGIRQGKSTWRKVL